MAPRWLTSAALVCGALSAAVLDEEVPSSSSPLWLEEDDCEGETCPALSLRQLRAKAAARQLETEEGGSLATEERPKHHHSSDSSDSPAPAPKVVRTGPLLRGISYGPSPLLHTGDLPNDDFMSNSAKAQWSQEGRGDLALIKTLGANAVRLYGNDPREDHTDFLNEAASLGLSVIPGNSDWPYVQSPDNCRQHSDYNCYEQVKAAYLQNLKGGFVKDGKYHKALKYIVAVNEPDMKLPDISQPKQFTKGLISALDGMLDAEKEAGVTGGNLPSFTVTFSFSVCPECGGGYSKVPALGQIWELAQGLLNPEKYGYKPKNDLTKFYNTRFVNSINTANPAMEIRPLFLNKYEAAFPKTNVFIAEWHCPNMDTYKEMQEIMTIARSSPVLIGVSYFEWQNRKDAGGHTTFGMFDLGTEPSQDLTTMDFFGSTYPVKCLVPVKEKDGVGIPAKLAKAFGGTYQEQLGCSLGALRAVVNAAPLAANDTP